MKLSSVLRTEVRLDIGNAPALSFQRRCLGPGLTSWAREYGFQKASVVGSAVQPCAGGSALCLVPCPLVFQLEESAAAQALRVVMRQVTGQSPRGSEPGQGMTVSHVTGSSPHRGKEIRPSQQRGSHCVFLALFAGCGGLAVGKLLTAKTFVVPCRDWGKRLTSGLLKWTAFVLLPSCLVALGCWVALPLLWVSPLRGEVRKASLKCPCWRMLSSYSILLWVIFDLGKKMP